MESIFIVTGVEVDGPLPGENAMRSFASVAVHETGEILDEFEAALLPPPTRRPTR